MVVGAPFLVVGRGKYTEHLAAAIVAWKRLRGQEVLNDCRGR